MRQAWLRKAIFAFSPAGRPPTSYPQMSPSPASPLLIAFEDASSANFMKSPHLYHYLQDGHVRSDHMYEPLGPSYGRAMRVVRKQNGRICKLMSNSFFRKTL